MKTNKDRTEVFLRLSKEADANQESNDCTVKTVSVLCNIDYETALKLFLERGRKKNKPTTMDVLRSVIEHLNYSMVEVDIKDIINQYPGKQKEVLTNITSNHPKRFNSVWKNGKSYLMNTKGHVLPIVDGVNHDWSVGRTLRAINLYEVYKN